MYDDEGPAAEATSLQHSLGDCPVARSQTNPGSQFYGTNAKRLKEREIVLQLVFWAPSSVFTKATVEQRAIGPVPRAHAQRNPRQGRQHRQSQRRMQDDCRVESLLTNGPPQLDEPAAPPVSTLCIIDQDLIQVRVSLDDLSRSRRHQERKVGLRECSAKVADHRRREDNIPDPIGADDQNAHPRKKQVEVEVRRSPSA
jgi:hypothetical protein